MKSIITLFCLSIYLLAIGVEQNIAAQSNPDHLFKDEAPTHVQTNVFITDDRGPSKSNSAALIEEIQQHLIKSFPNVKFKFVQKSRQLKRSGDNINILISIKAHGIVEKNATQETRTSYHISIYDVSRTPIYIQDGNVGYINKEVSEASIQENLKITNQRMTGFLRRNIKHHKFCDNQTEDNQN